MSGPALKKSAPRASLIVQHTNSKLTMRRQFRARLAQGVVLHRVWSTERELRPAYPDSEPSSKVAFCIYLERAAWPSRFLRMRILPSVFRAAPAVAHDPRWVVSSAPGCVSGGSITPAGKSDQRTCRWPGHKTSRNQGFGSPDVSPKSGYQIPRWRLIPIPILLCPCFEPKCLASAPPHSD